MAKKYMSAVQGLYLSIHDDISVVVHMRYIGRSSMSTFNSLDKETGQQLGAVWGSV